MSKNKVIDGVTFYPAAVAGKTEAEFIEHEKHHGFTEEQAKEIYSKLKPESAPVPAKKEKVSK